MLARGAVETDMTGSRTDDDLRCMRWPFGVLCLLDLAGTGCRNRAVCRLHDRTRNLLAYVPWGWR